MAQGVNKVILIGNLGSDPEVRYTQSGKAVCNFSMATSERWTDGNGQNQERTEWHKIVVWGRLAEICGQYLAKGRRAYVEGKLQTRTYEKDGETRYVTEVNASQVMFLDGGQQSQDNSGYGPPQQQQNYPPQQAPRRSPPDDDQIPF